MRRAARSSRGIALVMVTAALTALMGFAALGIDLAFLMETQGELSAAADATALAAASGLNVSLVEQDKTDEARRRAETYAALNKVAGQPLRLNAQNAPLKFGRWDTTTRAFQEGTLPTNAVLVSLELTESSIPPAPALFFAPVLGHGTGQLAASATAALVGSRDIVLALDRSGSMNDDTKPGGPQQPLTAVKDAAKNFVDLLQNSEGDQVGLVSYNQAASLAAQLTDQFGSVKTAIDKLNASGCTNIAAALCVARRESLSSRANAGAVPVIILLSDGRTNTMINPSTCLPQGNDCQFASVERNPNNPAALQAREEADKIARDRIVLYTISLGLQTNQELMTRMAVQTGGEHFIAPEAKDLEQIFREISERIPVALVE